MKDLDAPDLYRTIVVMYADMELLHGFATEGDLTPEELRAMVTMTFRRVKALIGSGGRANARGRFDAMVDMGFTQPIETVFPPDDPQRRVVSGNNPKGNAMNSTQRALASRHWKWLAGMKVIGRKAYATAWFRLEEDLAKLSGEWKDAKPDWDDVATVGCLLEIVRRAYGQNKPICTVKRDGNWWAGWPYGDIGFVIEGKGDTEAEALLVALGKAP